MGIFSKFEGRVEDTFEGAANKMFDSPISPVQIAKKAEKKMRREKIVGAGKQYAPTLYTVLVNPDDDHRLFGYYPTLAGETETYLCAKAMEEGLVMDGQPLVRFIVDEGLRRGKFDIVAEPVAAPIIEQLREEEMDRYGIGNNAGPGIKPVQNRKPPLPYVPEEEIDYSIDYDEYTFDSQDFEDYRENKPVSAGNFNNAQNPAPADRGYSRASDGFANNPARRPQVPPIPGAVGAGVAAGIGAGAAGVGIAGAQAHVPAIPPIEPSAASSLEAPNTVVFAAGSGNAHPSPNAAAVRAFLINTTNNRNYDLATSRLLIGRENTNDIIVDDINASRTHAELKYEPQGVWIITDLGSTNGTLVNGREASTHVLRDGDYITIGMTNYVFVQS